MEDIEYKENNTAMLVTKTNLFRQFIVKRFEALRKKEALKKIEIEVMYCLAVDKSCDTLMEINKRLNGNKGQLSRALLGLTEKGLVVAVHDDMDRRYVHYHLTETACELQNRVFEIFEAAGSDMLKGVTDEEKKIFCRVINKIEKNIEDEIRSKN